MGLFMAWILIFGYQKIFLIQDQLSETERVEIKNKIKETYEYCNDPLNSQNVKYLEIKTKISMEYVYLEMTSKAPNIKTLMDSRKYTKQVKM